jgi:putative protease
MGRKEDEWAGLSGNKSAQEKIFIGKVKRYYPKIKVAEVVIKARESINSSDEFLIIGQSTGVIRGNLNGMKVDEKNGVEEASQGDVITFEIQSKPRVGDQFFVVRERESLIPKGRDKSTTNV